MKDRFYENQLETKIRETVWRKTKDIPRPFGLVLSGGFDSGLLAALTKPDFVYTIRLDYGPRYDEFGYADAVIRHLGLTQRSTVIEFTKELFEQNAREAIRAMGHPVSHFSLVPFYVLMKTAKERMEKLGVVPNILSGEGIDEYLGGYARYIIFDKLNGLYQEPELVNYHETIDKVLKDNPMVKYMEHMGYTGEKVDKLTQSDTLSKMGDYSFLGKLGVMDMELGEIEQMEQTIAKKVGVNLHYPYIDPFLAEYCYRLPDEYKIRDGETKWLFRQIAMKYLPEIMRHRMKMGGPVAPVNHWLGGAQGEFTKEVWIKYQDNALI